MDESRDFESEIFYSKQKCELGGNFVASKIARIDSGY
jgi:hypothetical protein